MLIPQFDPVPGTNEFYHVSNWDTDRHMFIYHQVPQRWRSIHINGQRRMVRLTALDMAVRGRQREDAERALAAWTRQQTRDRMVTMTAQEFSAAMVRGTMVDVPPPPSLEDSIPEQKKQGLR